MQVDAGYPTTIDEYIAQYPEDVQRILVQIRAVIKEAAPQAGEKISYRMPSFHLHGALVWFAVHKRHIGFCATASGIEAFENELSAYKWAKGSVQFPLDKPIPQHLAVIVRYNLRRRRVECTSTSCRIGRASTGGATAWPSRLPPSGIGRDG